MKLLVIIMDGQGRIHVESSRAPDLRRRELSRATGMAEILFCAASQAPESTDRLIAHLKARLDQTDFPDRAHVRRLALWLVHIKPMARGWLGSPIRKARVLRMVIGSRHRFNDWLISGKGAA
ncbi:hypothetical protein [Pelagibacterium montanilacus]|uniref:hypothetical protein n=1 Tax=Pelagibacterium montanilacus TaxID=2185280 RepID=UPI000F8E1FD9|nr:hypothetical protein [Pelagibacterium montanilacus]